MYVKKWLFFILWGWANAVFGTHLTDRNDNDHYDVVVYGSSPAGVTAAVQSARMGKSVALLTPDAHLGGIVVERSEEHTSELQSLMRISYSVFCLKKKHE